MSVKMTMEQVTVTKNGEQRKINAVVDNFTQEALNEIETKKNDVLNSIPEDYQGMQEDIDRLKTDLDAEKAILDLFKDKTITFNDDGTITWS